MLRPESGTRVLQCNVSRNVAAMPSTSTPNTRVAYREITISPTFGRKTSKTRCKSRRHPRCGLARPQKSDETTVLPFAYRYRLVLLSQVDAPKVSVSLVRTLVGNQDFATWPGYGLGICFRMGVISGCAFRSWRISYYVVKQQLPGRCVGSWGRCCLRGAPGKGGCREG
jgi:hypothetical protein